MKVLIIIGHPRENSFTAALARAYAEGAGQAGSDVRIRDLSKAQFAPDVLTASPCDQPLEPDLHEILESIKWAEHLVIAYPAWWGMGPARLKALFDRILLPGIAFYQDSSGRLHGLLAGRTAHLITCLDMPPWVYRWIYRAAGHVALRRSILGVCGINTVRIHLVGPVSSAADSQRTRWLEEVRQLGETLRNGPFSRSDRLRNQAAAWLRAMRLQFFPMSWMAYSFGALMGITHLSFTQVIAYIVGYLVLLSVKLATVFSNELFDFESDRVNKNAGPFNGGSQVLVDGSIKATQLKMATFVLLGFSAVFGIASILLTASGSVATLLLVLITLALGYSIPPLQLNWRGWGEFDVAITHGIGVVLWGYVMQGGHGLDSAPWHLGIPLSLSILPAILMSGIPDIDADRIAGKETFAVRNGKGATLLLASASCIVATVLAVGLNLTNLSAAFSPVTVLFLTAHSILLLGLISLHQSFSAGLQLAIVCALLFIMWFTVVPLLHFAFHSMTYRAAPF